VQVLAAYLASVEFPYNSEELQRIQNTKDLTVKLIKLQTGRLASASHLVTHK